MRAHPTHHQLTLITYVLYFFLEVCYFLGYTFDTFYIKVHITDENFFNKTYGAHTMKATTKKTSISKTLTSWYQDVFNHSKKNDHYSRELTIAACLGLLVAGGYYSYRWYTNNKNSAAHALFSQNLEELERVMQDGKQEDWASIQTLFKLGYDQYPKSSLAPYFLAYQAEALIKQGELEQAISTMHKAVDQMPSNSPVLGLYKTKVALMELDSANTDTQKTGLESLHAIAQHAGSTAQDVAAYHLGLYYWVKNDTAQAKHVWTALIEATHSKDKAGKSPWAAKAQEKLAQI